MDRIVIALHRSTWWVQRLVLDGGGASASMVARLRTEAVSCEVQDRSFNDFPPFGPESSKVLGINVSSEKWLGDVERSVHGLAHTSIEFITLPLVLVGGSSKALLGKFMDVSGGLADVYVLLELVRKVASIIRCAVGK